MKLLDATMRLALKSLLFATDFSPASQAALPYAAAIARRYGARLCLAHVVRPQVWAPAPPEWVPMESEVPRQTAMTEMSKLEQSSLLAGLPHQVAIAEGAVWECLSRLLRGQETDLLIMGTHGRRGLQKLLMGSVAEELFRLAPCPVLTVGPHVPAARPGSGLPALLFATDFSADSARALPYALSAAREFGSELTLLHVLEPGEEMGGDRGGRDARLQARLQEMLGSEAGKVRARTEIAGGDPAERIVKAAGQRGAGLIVLGLKAPQMFADRLPWLYAYRIVSQAPCPVLTVRGNVAEPAG